MKKFKTSAEKKDLHDSHLEHLLADKKLLHNALVNYSNAPIGILIAVCMVGLGFLQGLPLFSQESAILAQMGVSFVAVFYMFKAYSAFNSHRHKLAHVRNSFVGSLILPGLFSALVLFMSLAFNWKSFVVALISIGLAAATHFYLSSKALHKPLTGVYLCLPLLLPALAIAGPSRTTALAATAGCAVLVFMLSQLQPKLFLI